MEAPDKPNPPVAGLTCGTFNYHLSYQEFLDLTQGLPIVGMDNLGGVFFLILAGGLKIRITQTGDGVSLNLIGQQEERSPIIIKFPSDEVRPSVVDLENRLRALRQLYAIVYLLMHDDVRLNVLTQPESKESNFDIEHSCLFREEHLFIESFAPGSWITTIWTKSKEAREALILLAATVWDNGRDNILRRVAAGTRIKEAEADSKEFELLKLKLDYIQKVAKKNPELQRAVDQIIESALVDIIGTRPTRSLQTADDILKIKSRFTGSEYVPLDLNNLSVKERQRIELDKYLSKKDGD